MPIYNNIIETIGRTPVVRINKLAPDHVEVYAKLEAWNPMGSVKDRLAIGVIEAAEKSGELKPGQTVVEATSGNTGIGLAMVCAQRGYPFVAVMAEAFSIERRKIMRFLGAKVVLTPAAEKGMGMLGKAKELADKHGWFFVRQFENPANAAIHMRTTAVEIMEDFPDGLDYWVTGFGTGGTLNGVSKVLKEKMPETRIVVCEPDNSAAFRSGITTDWPADGVPKESHPLWRPHPIQGWSPDFIPDLVEVTRERVDEILPVSGDESFRLAHALATEEGIFTGISGGATLAGALLIAERAEPGAKILCMLPDTGERYLSTPLFQDIATDMTEDEIAISHSTPNFRFDKAPDVPPPAVEVEAHATPEAHAFVTEVLESSEKPVVIFALAWCEFCWAVRRLFAGCDIDYKAVELDSVAFQEDNWGGKVRAALTERTDVATIPQVFVGGELIGGASDTFAAFDKGELQKLFEKYDVSFEDKVGDKLYTLMPGWVQR